MTVSKSLREIDYDLPNGFHDAFLETLTLNYAANSATLDLNLWVGELYAATEEEREAYKRAKLHLTDLVYLVIEPPYPRPDYKYEYDMADQVTSITYPFGCNLKVVYDYDDRGRLKTVGDTSDPARFATFYYTSRGEIDHVVLGDSLQVVDYTYNPRGWLNAINDGASDTSAAGDLFGEQLYYYDYPGQPWTGEKNGNIMAQKISMAGTDHVRHYGYDDIDRLTSVTELDSSLEAGLESFSYDGNGNRLSYQQIVGQDTNSTTYSYRSTGNILESLTSNTGNRDFSWDENGNMVHDSRLGGLSHLYYDIYNQLEEAHWTNIIGDDYIKFGYNVSGERVYKEYKYFYRDICDGHEWEPPGGFTVLGDSTLGGTTLSSGTLPPDDTLCIFSQTTYTRYIVSKGKVLAEYSGVTGSSREFTFIYAGDQRIAMIDKNGKLHFYLNDHLGSARLVIDTAGTVKDNYDYYAFGEALDQTISTGQSYRYTGKPFDNDHSLNLHYSGARYYDGTTGRFISVDPLASKSPAWSPFVYVKDNALNRLDPQGLTDILFMLQRTGQTSKSTSGDYTVANSYDGQTITGHSLELPDKGNKQWVSRIPSGSYRLELTESRKFQRKLPILLDVPGRSDIRIHRGNFPKNTTGCLLVGKNCSTDLVTNSAKAENEIVDYMKSIQFLDKILGEETCMEAIILDEPQTNDQSASDDQGAGDEEELTEQ